VEALMTDGKALQMATSHNLGQHFSKAFDIKFEDRNQTLQYVWQTSWGMTTRTIGALIMVHGDDSGLRFPPRIAPTQVILVPISIGNWKETVLPAARAAVERLRALGLRVEIDAREEATPGWKFSEYEMRGVPLRVEIGPRDVKNGQAVLVRRDTAGKETVPLADLEARVPVLLDEIQAGLMAQARAFLESNIRDAADYAAFKDILETRRGFIRAPWCGGEACEAKIKAETMATIRIIPLDEAAAGTDRPCIACGSAGQAMAYFARAY
ncbi:MAG: prolyl-tRNA synthetase, partial [Candidatus Aminicenantes bacterium]|nr:prolyl-tRNA synthetase [Candidatus Aminicenantes bacterium]